MNASRNKSKNTNNIRISIDGKHPDQTSEDCIICCEKVTDKAFVNVCLHYFCYKCIKEWVNVRAVCPLCVQPISSIINNIRSVDDYDLQEVKPPENDILSNLDNDVGVDFWEDEEDDFLNDDEISEISFDGTALVLSSSDSEDDFVDHYDETMDEDSDGVNISDESYEAPVEVEDDITEEEESSNSENEDTRSFQSSNSGMENDLWQVDFTDYENDVGSENEAESYYDSEENDDEHDYSYSDPYDELDDNSPVHYSYSDDCGSMISWDQSDPEESGQDYSDGDSSDSY